MLALDDAPKEQEQCQKVLCMPRHFENVEAHGVSKWLAIAVGKRKLHVPRKPSLANDRQP
jgi:hypothetical protein